MSDALPSLRLYQATLVDQLRGAYRAGFRAPLLQLATGGGKTVVFATITASAHGRGKSVLVAAHRRELIRQASAKLTAAGVPHGIIAPGHAETADRVQVGSVATLVRRLERLPAFDLVVVDDCAACGMANALAMFVCENCGVEFPIKEPDTPAPGHLVELTRERIDFLAHQPHHRLREIGLTKAEECAVARERGYHRKWAVHFLREQAARNMP